MVKLFLKLAVVALLANAAYRVGLEYLTYVKFRDAVRDAATYKTKDDLKVRVVYCGVLDGEWFYGIRYSAAQRHYFDKDLKTFEMVLRSFKLKTNA